MLSQYCGLPFNRDEAESDVMECVIESDVKFYREVYGVDYRPEDFIRAGEIGEQAREDMRAGVPVGESEAAQEMIRQYAIQPVRLKKHTEAFAAYIAGLDSRIPDCDFTE